MTTKKCFKCGIEYPLIFFYKHKRMADGHLNKCKSCTRNDANKTRKDNIDYYREYDVRRSKTEHRKKHLAANAVKDREKFPEKYKARTYLNNAIRDGRAFKQPCCICGSLKSMGHHEDYNDPLNVIWVCAIHHHQIDKR